MLYLNGRDKGRGLCYFSNIVCCLLLFLTQISISHGADPGDANDDGKISQSDIGAVVNHILGTESASGNPDCNTDGTVDIRDVICVIKLVQNQGPPDPEEVASPVDPTAATNLGTSTEFLYTGSIPI